MKMHFTLGGHYIFFVGETTIGWWERGDGLNGETFLIVSSDTFCVFLRP